MQEIKTQADKNIVARYFGKYSHNIVAVLENVLKEMRCSEFRIDSDFLYYSNDCKKERINIRELMLNIFCTEDSIDSSIEDQNLAFEKTLSTIFATLGKK